MNNIVSHRSYIRQGSLAGLRVAVVLAFIFGIPFGSEKTRIAINGIGLRGQNHLYNLLQRSDVVIPAICDTDQGMINKSQKMKGKAGFKLPEVNNSSDYAYCDLLLRNDIDGVIIPAPQLWPPIMTVDTMEAGKYAGVEVSAAHTIEDCWDMVNAFEESGSHCMILENVCSRRDIMAIHKHGDAGYVWRVDPCPLWLPA